MKYKGKRQPVFCVIPDRKDRKDERKIPETGKKNEEDNEIF